MTARKQPKSLVVPKTGEISKKVAIALRKVPPRQFDRAEAKKPAYRDVPLEHIPDIDGMSEKYEYLIGPKAISPAKNKTAAQLAGVLKHAEGLFYALNCLQGPALDALAGFASNTDSRLTLGQLERLTERLVTSADSALRASHSAAAGKREANSHSIEVARAVAIDFYLLTGKAPTRTVAYDSSRKKKVSEGPFPGLLGEIFAALGIKRNVEDAAREAASWFARHGKAHLTRHIDAALRSME